MCRPFSCIITKNQRVYTHPNPLLHSHTEIMKHFNLKESDKDSRFNYFVKIESYPKNDQPLLTTPTDKWLIKVDEKYTPLWYQEDRDSYETIIRKAAISWLNKIRERDWSKATPGECYEYARMLKGRFELGEKTIATSACCSYDYSKYVLNGRFQLGEKIIATNAKYSYYYAKNILKAPFPQAEKIIAKDAQYSYLYALDILKGSFPLGEKAIATDGAYSYMYANYVLKGPFLLGEKAIAKILHLSKDYLIHLIKPDAQHLNIVNKHQKKYKKKTFHSIQVALNNLPSRYIMHILAK